MTILFLLVPLALALGFLFLGGFLFAARTGQLNDLETPALRALIDNSEEQGSRKKPAGLPKGTK